MDSVTVVGDVMSLLKVSTPAIGYLCSNQHGKINIWSRYKPVRHSAPFPDRSNPRYFEGDLGDCGIVVSTVRSYLEVKSTMDADDGLRGWMYVTPTENFAIVDFCGYDHFALPPVAAFGQEGAVMTILENGTFNAGLMMAADTGTQPGGLSLYDLKCNGSRLSEWNLGVVIYDSNGNRKGRVVGDGLDASFNVNALTTGKTYYAYPFLARYPMGQNELDRINEYVVLPYIMPEEFKIVSKVTYYGFNCRIDATLNGSSVKWYLTISSKLEVLISSCSVRLRFVESQSTDALVRGEQITNLNDVTSVSELNSYLNSGSFTYPTPPSDSYSGNVKVEVVINSPTLGLLTEEVYVLSQNLNPIN